MPKPRSFLRIFSESGPLIAVAVALAMLLGIAVPASAQFFPFGRAAPQPQRQQSQPSPFGGGGFPFFAPFEQQPRPQPRVDYSRAPAPEKSDVIPERNVLVLGDAMADWLAYGLEDAFSEQPDMGVTRKHKTVSGLIKYQPRGEPSDWVAAAKGIVAAEKADVIVVMLGINDRTSIREPVADPKAADKATDPKAADKKKADARPAAKPDDKPVDAEAADDQADGGDTPSIAAPEKSARSPNGVYEFRDARWVELYTRKIEEMIAVLKTKGVPVLWVGLPAVRGPKATSDMLFLDALYRDSAAKAGITYVDVWDGFVDEAGRFLQQGPDFEGQTRRLRAADGVYFTKPGARKLAHYVDREIKRLLANRATPVALPVEPATPDGAVRPGGPAPRPMAGPIVPLVASSVGTTELLGGAGTRPAAVDALAARTLVKGEPLAPPPGRADDYAWPRREVGRLDSTKDTPVASGSPDGAAGPDGAAPKPPVKRRPRPQLADPQPGAGWPSFFGRPSPPAQPRPQTPRPPAAVGRSASVPGFFQR